MADRPPFPPPVPSGTAGNEDERGNGNKCRAAGRRNAGCDIGSDGRIGRVADPCKELMDGRVSAETLRVCGEEGLECG